MGKKRLLCKLGIALTCMFLVLNIADVSAAFLGSWDKKITNAKKRFKILKQFNKEAVLDKETQLVWQRQPSTLTPDWDSALDSSCSRIELGGRWGWRAPTTEELASLIDPSQFSPALPNNHPFIDVQNTEYWSATTAPRNDGHLTYGQNANTVSFNGFGSVLEEDKNSSLPVWCVRGGQGFDGGMNP